ncbi:glycosyltransferase [Acidobacteria bacterium AB60]|nr:glycosyltransferase [Acidobacteria bacterium AB60]
MAAYMRVAFMLTSLGIGGAEKQAIALAERMHARGHDVLVLVLSRQLGEEWPAAVEIVHLGMRKTCWSVLRGVRRAVLVLRAFRPQILHCHNFHGNVLGRLLRVALPSLSVVSTIHNVYEGGWLRMAAYRLTDRLSRCTIAVCDAAAKSALQQGAVRGACRVIANGIDLTEFVPSRARREDTRRAMGVADEFLWIAVGRVVLAKDYENLLRAFALLREIHTRAKLCIAGEATSLYAECMIALVGELGLARAVRWLGLQHDIASLLDAADGFVLASAWEGMPLAVGEAMAMEKIVVTTDVGGVRELLGDSGLLVPERNPRKLAEAMRRVMNLADCPNTQRMQRAARDRIEQRFTMEASVTKWEQLYRSVAGPKA